MTAFFGPGRFAGAGFFTSGFSPVQIPNLALWESTRRNDLVITDGAQQFTSASSQYFQGSASTDLTGDIDLYIAGWIYLDSTGSSKTIAAKYNFSTSQRSWWVTIASNVLQLVVSADGSSGAAVTLTDNTVLSTSTWYFIEAWHDATNNQIGICVNRGTPTTSSYSVGLFSTSLPLTIGAYNTVSSATNFFGGRIDSLGIWTRIPPSTERDALRNSGNGITSTDLTDALKVGLFDFFDLDESSGNTVGAVNGVSLSPSTSRPTIVNGIAQGRATDGDIVRAVTGLASGHQFTQSTVTLKPLYKTNISNGQPVLRFDGTDDRLAGGSSTFSISRNQSALTVVMVGGWRGFKGAAQSIAIGMGTGLGGTRAGVVAGTNSSGSAVRRLVARGADSDSVSTISSASTYTTGVEILIGIFDFANKRGRILRNGTEILAYTSFASMTGTATGDTDSTFFTFGTSNTVDPSELDLGEGLVYQGIPTDDELRQLAQYFGLIYGISVA